MELLAEHRGKFNAVVELYYFSSNQTEKYWGRDNLAALKIQSKFKMYMKRKEFLRMKAGRLRLMQRRFELKQPSGRTMHGSALQFVSNKSSTEGVSTSSLSKPR